MIFIETSIFTEAVKKLLTDDEYSVFQDYLSAHPEAGDLIVGTGGLRKVRCKSQGTGKNGGVRVITFMFQALHIFGCC